MVLYQTPCLPLVHRWALAATCTPQIPQEHTLPARSHAFTIAEFGRGVTQHILSCCTSGGRRLIPTGLLLHLAFRAGLHPNQLIESKVFFLYFGTKIPPDFSSTSRSMLVFIPTSLSRTRSCSYILARRSPISSLMRLSAPTVSLACCPD